MYESAYAGTNQATSVTFNMSHPSEFDGEVAELRARASSFEFEGPYGVEWNDGVASIVGMGRAVWFTDLDGNILNLAAREHWPALPAALCGIGSHGVGPSRRR